MTYQEALDARPRCSCCSRGCKGNDGPTDEPCNPYWSRGNVHLCDWCREHECDTSSLTAVPAGQAPFWGDEETERTGRIY